LSGQKERPRNEETQGSALEKHRKFKSKGRMLFEKQRIPIIFFLFFFNALKKKKKKKLMEAYVGRGKLGSYCGRGSLHIYIYILKKRLLEFGGATSI
jgi:hypothetical protein